MAKYFFMNPKPKFSNIYLLLIIALGTILLAAKATERIQLPPSSVHQWRQSDCAAYVKTFYRNSTNILTPGTFNLAGKGGRVASEFPLLYYIAAQIEQVVGEHYWVIRGLTVLCYLSGIIALLAISRRYIKGYYALFSVLLLASSPYYYYYAVNFLPNIPAISFSFIGLYFFLKYESGRKMHHMLLGTFFFLLATVLKPTDGGVLWLAYLLTWVCLNIKKMQLRNYLPILISTIAILFSVYGWVKYVDWYNNLNGNHQNLQSIYPYWDMDDGLFEYTKARVIKEWSKVFQYRFALYLLALMFVVYIVKWKSLNPFLRLLTLFLFMGTAGYTILWFKAYTDHDYYQLVFVLPAVFLSITVVEFYVRVWLPIAGKAISYGVSGLLLTVFYVAIFYNRKIQEERYSDSGHWVVNPAMFEIEPFLGTLGIGENDAVVCVPDKSPNVSLNAINRYGYTEEFNSDEYNINLFQQKGAAYLIISDSSYLKNPLYEPYTQRLLGEYKGIHVFDIR